MLQIKKDNKIYDVDINYFPNGEINIKLDPIIINNNYKIIFKWFDDKDFMHLYFFVNYLKQLNAFKRCDGLFIPYLPYSRMDRIENNNMFTLKYISDFINQFDFKQIEVLEPHSNVSLNLIHNIKPIYKSVDMLYEELKLIDEDVTIVLPDKGAFDRYNQIIDQNYIKTIFNYQFNIMYCEKQRNFKTGQIKNIKLIDTNKKLYDNIIIVDDLCSKGGTFIGCKEAILKNKSNIKNITLIITHAEHNPILSGSIFKDNHFNKVIITNSMLNTKDNKDINQEIFKHKAKLNNTKLKIYNAII